MMISPVSRTASLFGFICDHFLKINRHSVCASIACGECENQPQEVTLRLSIQSDRWLAPAQLLPFLVALAEAISSCERTSQSIPNLIEAEQPCARSRLARHRQTSLASPRALSCSSTNCCLFAPNPFVLHLRACPAFEGRARASLAR